jgi:hypothetical protein
MTATFGYWPFDGGPGADSTEPEWVDMFQYMRSTGIINMSGSLSPTGDCAVLPESGLVVQITTGIAWMVGTFFMHTVDPFYQDITANYDPDGYDRIDRITLRTDFDANTTAYTYLEGTPSASPVAPDIIQVVNYIWDLPLAEIYVANGATEITSMDITDQRVRSVQDGGAVTLTSDGGDQGLVTSALGPDLAIKGLSAGSNITLTSASDYVTIAATSTPSDSPICVLRRNANLTVNNGSFPIISWTTAVTDPYSMWNGNTTINIAESGWYAIILNLSWTGDVSANGSLLAYVTKVGTRLAESRVMMVGAENVSNNLSTIASLVNGDAITAVVTNNSGVNLTMPTGGSYTPVLSLYKVRS